MALLVLASCTEFPLTYADLQGLPDETPYRQQALSDGWISTDRAQLILERRDRSVLEQRILLTNRTAMKGENLILLRAETAPNALETRFQPEILLADTGGVPAPFGRFESLSFTVTEDALGVINWTSWTNYAGLT
ncbi:MAG: hypothetical protein GYB53_23830, partial [Rhodobacteraceae bacterium]|nr:hypothetical protein [Paracoccaceae bacterium]